eukprot:jgi/Psemu1/29532/gm1.29532_g
MPNSQARPGQDKTRQDKTGHNRNQSINQSINNSSACRTIPPIAIARRTSCSRNRNATPDVTKIRFILKYTIGLAVQFSPSADETTTTTTSPKGISTRNNDLPTVDGVGLVLVLGVRNRPGYNNTNRHRLLELSFRPSIRIRIHIHVDKIHIYEGGGGGGDDNPSARDHGFPTPCTQIAFASSSTTTTTATTSNATTTPSMAAVFVETIAAETVAATAAAAEYASPLRVSDLADYAPAATSLFNNMKLPAAVVTAGMISLGFATGFPELPRETPDNKHIFTPRIRKRCEALKRLHIVVALIAVTSELIVVMWAAVEVNQLTEKRYALAASVWDLIQRDCDLAWSAVNSHFVLGIIGFVAMLTLRAYVMLLAAEASNALLTAAGAGTGAALCLMISIVNRGVESGGGNGERYGSTIVDLLQHYVVLLFREATQEISPGPLQLAAIVLESISLVYMANVLVFQNGKAENPPPSLLLLQADETQPQDEECNNNNNNNNSPPVTVLEWFDATSPGSSTNTNSSGGSDPKEGNNKNKKKKVLVMVDVDGSNNNINNNTTLKNSNSETSISDANDQPGSKKAGRPLTLEERKTLAECLDLKDERNDQPDGEEGNDDEDDEEEQRRMDSGDFPSVTVL